MPPADEVRDALQRVLASDAFARSDRARRLLAYLVERDLAGEADRLKGFSIAIDVFGKDERFDSATDTVVRVQAGRLRELLAQYYALQGQGDRLRIAIPRGSYAPQYLQAGEPEAGELEAPGASVWPVPAQPAGGARNARLRSPWRRRVVLGCAVAGLLLVAAFYSALFHWGPLGDTVVSDGIANARQLEGSGAQVEQSLLPSVFLEFDAMDAGSERIASVLRRGLAGFDTVDFIAPSRNPGEAGARRDTDFLFLVESGAVPGEIHIEVQNVASGKVLLSLNVPVARRAWTEVEDRVAEILTAAVPVSGAIYANLAESGTQTALTHCLAVNYNFYRNQGPQTHRAAYECLQQLIERGLQSPLVQAEFASLHLQAVIAGYNPPAAASAEQALSLARAAVQSGPGSPSAHRAMGYVLARTIGTPKSIRWTRKAYELNVFDLSMAAAYGYGLIFAGDYEKGAPVLERAIKATSAHPPWWDYGLFLGQFMQGDMAAAAKTVTALTGLNRAHYIAARLLVANAEDDREQAAALIAELRGAHPQFSADPRSFFERGRYPAALTERLVEGLRGAGLSGES